MNKDYLMKETICLLSADIYKDIYKHSEGFTDACSTIIALAEEFEKRLNWQEDDERDYIFELEKFEKEVLERYS